MRSAPIAWSDPDTSVITNSPSARKKMKQYGKIAETSGGKGEVPNADIDPATVSGARKAAACSA